MPTLPLRALYQLVRVLHVKNKLYHWGKQRRNNDFISSTTVTYMSTLDFVKARNDAKGRATTRKIESYYSQWIWMNWVSRWVSIKSCVCFCSMMTSSDGNIFRVTRPLCGEITGHPWIPSQRPVARSFDVLFDLRLDKQLSEQSRRRWFETSSRSLWRYCNVQLIDLVTQYGDTDLDRHSLRQCLVSLHLLPEPILTSLQWGSMALT